MSLGEAVLKELERRGRVARPREPRRSVRLPKFPRRRRKAAEEGRRSLLWFVRSRSKRAEVSVTERASYELIEKVNGSVITYDVSTSTAYVWLGDGAYDLGRWGFLKPLVENADVQEIHVRGASIAILHAELGRFKVRYADYEVTESEAARLIANLSAYARAAVDFENPAGYGELDGWRVYVKLDVVSGLPELVATRVIRIPDLTEWLSPWAAARVLTLALLPHATVIFGPPGSGKTTFLNSLLLKIHELFPWLSMSVVETVPELVLPESPSIHRTAPMLAEERLSVSEAVSRAFRFERPHVLVLGELRGDELRSWQEVARAGIPALTTVHAPDLDRCVSTLTSLLEAAGVPLRLTDHFRLFVEMGRVEGRKVLRYVRSVTLFTRGRPVRVYGEGAVDEEGFLRLLEGAGSFLGSARELYNRVLSNL